MPHKHVVKSRWTGKWLGQIKKPRRIRKLFDTKAEAIAWEVEMKKSVEHQEPVETKTATVSLIEWANRYLDYCVRYVPKTYSEKKNTMKRLLAEIGKDAPVDSMKPGQALDHLQRHFRAHSGYSANKVRKNLVAAWAWGARFIDGFPNVNPFDAVPKFPEQEQERYVPPEEDFRAVAEVAEGQDRLLLMAFLHTAARRGELYRLKWSDIDFGEREIRLTTRKRKDGSMQADHIPMTDELYNALLEHKQTAVNEWVFTQSVGRHKGKPYTENRGFPQDLCEKTGVKPFGCRGIRRLTASILAKNNVPMVDIMRILRHRKLATTERYVRGLEPVRPHLKVLEGGFSGRNSNDESNTKKRRA